MPRFLFTVFLHSILCLITCFAPDNHLLAQQIHPEDYADLITIDSLASPINFLSDPKLTGRETGTPGGSSAAIYIAEQFESYGLRPLGNPNPLKHSTTYMQPFYCPTRQQGKNVIGLLPADNPQSKEYVILSAHFDHLGTIKDVLYPGADCNASGVSVLLNIARTLSLMKDDDKGSKRNYIFVCYDAKEFSMTGAQLFSMALAIPPAQIKAYINIDQIGTTLEPPFKSKNYALVLGADKAPDYLRNALVNCNAFYNTQLELDFSFYDSPTFAEVYFEMTEQSFLAKLEVPSVLVTSGVHDHTYKPTDTADIIDYPVLQKRAKWLFYTLWDLGQL